MLLYEYQLRDQIEKLREYACNVLTKFQAQAPTAELLIDARNLKQIYDILQDMLPHEIKDVGNCGRHIYWIIHWLEKDAPKSCESDIAEICSQDIKDIEKAFRKWCAKQDHYDSELTSNIASLLVKQEWDSAVRKAFVILKERLVSTFHVPQNLDGADLVNNIFGSKTPNPLLKIDADERQAYRDLLAGLYSVFRNKFAHTNYKTTWAEADGVIAMVNLVLKDLGGLTK